MKNLLIALVLVLGVSFVADWSMAAKEDAQQITGILIDAKCGVTKEGKAKSEADAAGHKSSCVLACAKNGPLQVISGEKVYKLDDASKAKAVEYLTNEKSEGNTRVAIEGTVKDDTLTITSIKKAEAKKAA